MAKWPRYVFDPRTGDYEIKWVEWAKEEHPRQSTGGGFSRGWCGCWTFGVSIPLALLGGIIMVGTTAGGEPAGIGNVGWALGVFLLGLAGFVLLGGLLSIFYTVALTDFRSSGWWHLPLGILALPALVFLLWLADAHPLAMYWVSPFLGLAALWGGWSLVRAWRHQGKRFRRLSRILVVIGLVVIAGLGLNGYAESLGTGCTGCQPADLRLGSLFFVIVGLAITGIGRALMRGTEAQRTTG